MRRRVPIRHVLLCGLAVFPGAIAGALAGSDRWPEPRVGFVDTGVLTIDRIYPSMEGPSDRIRMDPEPMDWVIAFKTVVLDDETEQPMGEEFFCHSQLQVSSKTRLMVAATGSSEIRFPPGFAMPVSRILEGTSATDRQLSFLGMVLNNHEADIDKKVRVRGIVEFHTDEDLEGRPPLKKLFKVGLPMAVEDATAASAPPTPETTEEDLATHCVLVGGLKGHWMVPPGRQVTRRVFEHIVPVESTVHAAITHLHNYGDSLKLTDLTTGEVLFRTDVVYEPERKQIAEIPAYSSPTGFKIYPDHRYEIEAVYTNTTDHDVDAMAVMDLYYHPAGNVMIRYAPE